ncbi:hypothetical protein EI555_019821, partial [Monodon monoceros]
FISRFKRLRSQKSVSSNHTAGKLKIRNIQVSHINRFYYKKTDVIITYYCLETFCWRMELPVHLASHTGEMPFKGCACSQQLMKKKFMQSKGTKLHGAPKLHTCPTRAKFFLSQRELQLHQAFKHCGELFACKEFCCVQQEWPVDAHQGQTQELEGIHAFTQKAGLNLHLSRHVGQKPFQCHLCGYTFCTQAGLEKRNLTTPQLPFFENSPNTEADLKRVPPGGSHFCRICGKTFKVMSQLCGHVRQHKGVRKFNCTERGSKFTQ